MSDSSKPSGAGRGGDAGEETFAAQVLRYLDGEATPQDLSDLRDALSRLPQRRTAFVAICRLHGELAELLAPARVRRAGSGSGAGAGAGTAPAPEPASAPEAPKADKEPGPPAEDDTTFHPRDSGDDTRH